GRRTAEGSAAAAQRPSGRGSVKGGSRTKQTSTTKDEVDDIDESDNYPAGFLQKLKALRATKLQAAASNRPLPPTGSSFDTLTAASSQKLDTETTFGRQFNKAEYQQERQRTKKDHSNTLEEDDFKPSVKEKSRKVNLLVAPSPPSENSEDEHRVESPTNVQQFNKVKSSASSLRSSNLNVASAADENHLTARHRDTSHFEKDSNNKFNAPSKTARPRTRENKNEFANLPVQREQPTIQSPSPIQKSPPRFGSSYRNRFTKTSHISESENSLTSNDEAREAEVTTRSGLLGRQRPPAFRPPLPETQSRNTYSSKTRSTTPPPIRNIPNYKKSTTPSSFEGSRSSSVATPHRFSARYRTDLLRGNGNIRTTATPAYIPTVPTVTTPSAESFYFAAKMGSTLKLGKASYLQANYL
ncbi:Protein of unknown function, partial [Gryllus bimaculatus]